MEHQNEEQKVVDQIYDYAEQLMLVEKKAAQETINALIEQGLDEENATVVVFNLEKQIKAEKKERAKKDILYGALWFVGGTVITVATYSAASGGGRYMIAWGAILLGGVQLVKGLVNISKEN